MTSTEPATLVAEFDRRATEIPGVKRQVSSRRGHGNSYLAGEREIAHFHGAERLDIRLTSTVIKKRLAEGGFDEGVSARSPTANWVAVHLTADTLPLALDLLRVAIRANA